MTNPYETPDEALKKAIESVGNPRADQPVIKVTVDGMYYFVSNPDELFTANQLVNKLARLAPAAQAAARPTPDNGNGKVKKPVVRTIEKPKLSVFRKEKALPVVYRHVKNETINLQAGSLMPKSDKILFIDPKAVEMMPKATPRVKLIFEHMSMPVKKKPIDPRLLIGVAIMSVIVIIGITILYSNVISPADKAQKAYDLEVLRNGGNTTGITKPGGSLFKFEPPNPFAPMPQPK